MKKLTLHFILSALVFLILLPFLSAALFSISPGWKWDMLLPESFSLRYWSYILTPQARFISSASLSLGLSLAVTLITAAVCIPFSERLARHNFKGRGVINALLFLPIIIPGYIPFMGIHLTMVRLGITDTAAGVILAHLPLTIPYMTRALIVSFENLSEQYEDAARLLGAGTLETFFHITLPHIFPALAAGTSLSFLVSYSQYLVTLIIGGGNVITLPILMFPFFSGGESGVGSVYALGFIFSALIPLLLMDRAVSAYYSSKHGFIS